METKIKEFVSAFWPESQGVFPGAQPVSVERKDFDTLTSAGYVMCAKLDGERFFLVAVDGCDPVLMNRRMDILPTDIRFNPYVAKKGLLLDGELIDGVFVVHDAVHVIGRTVKDLPHYERIRIARAAVRMATAGQVFIKQFFLPNDSEGLKTAMNNCRNDGVVLYPIADPVGCRTQSNFFKWKPPGHHTVDFLVKPGKDGNVKLITWSNKREKVYATVPTPPFPVPGVVEFNTVIENDKVRFDPIKARPDKHQGNSMFTLTRTILNVKENISFEEIMQAVKPAEKKAPKPAPKPAAKPEPKPVNVPKDIVDPKTYRRVRPGKTKSTLAKEAELAKAMGDMDISK